MQVASLTHALAQELQTRFELGFEIRAPHLSPTQRRLSAMMSVQLFKAVLPLVLQAEKAEQMVLEAVEEREDYLESISSRQNEEKLS